jgi:transcriptional regulator with XRE-family HTH domain
MARQERPIDPAAGPVQSLAYDLRKLRVEAGSPTYRAMARKTGYSASTLSEAASGIRRPSLDVLLAYVGVLNGDQAAWRKRWQDLDPMPAAHLPHRPARRPAGRWVLAAVLALVLLGAGTAWGVGRGRPEPAAVPGCPAVAGGALFTATTYGSGAKVRQGPARAQPELYAIPAGCTVGLTGFCLGEPILDATAGTPDVRWFMVAGGGMLASAIVHGNPPDGTGLSRCPGDRNQPTEISLRVTEEAGRITLNATGSGVDVVGYAAYHPDPAVPDGPPAWHQIALTARGATVPWQRPAGTAPVVAAVACLGGESPTEVADLRTLDGEAAPAAAHRGAAAEIACLYPVAK